MNQNRILKNVQITQKKTRKLKPRNQKLENKQKTKKSGLCPNISIITLNGNGLKMKIDRVNKKI